MVTGGVDMGLWARMSFVLNIHFFQYMYPCQTSNLPSCPLLSCPYPCPLPIISHVLPTLFLLSPFRLQRAPIFFVKYYNYFFQVILLPLFCFLFPLSYLSPVIPWLLQALPPIQIPKLPRCYPRQTNLSPQPSLNIVTSHNNISNVNLIRGLQQRPAIYQLLADSQRARLALR